MIVTLSVMVSIAFISGGHLFRRIDFNDNYKTLWACQQAQVVLENVDLPGVTVKGRCYVSL